MECRKYQEHRYQKYSLHGTLCRCQKNRIRQKKTIFNYCIARFNYIDHQSRYVSRSTCNRIFQFFSDLLCDVWFCKAPTLAASYLFKLFRASPFLQTRISSSRQSYPWIESKVVIAYQAHHERTKFAEFIHDRSFVRSHRLIDLCLSPPMTLGQNHGRWTRVVVGA